MGIGTALISAGGAILGGLFGKSKQKVITSGQQLTSTVQAAKKLGIHPLAALGSGASYTPLPVYNNPIGPAVSKAADAVAQIPKEAINKEIAASQIEVNKAQAEVLRQQGTQIQTEVQANLRNGTTGARNVSNPSKPPGLFIDVTGEQGQSIRVPDMQRAGDLETTIAARIEDGSFFKWAQNAINKNLMPLWKMDKYVQQNLKYLSPEKAKKLRSAWETLKKSAASKKRPHDAGLYTP